MILSYCITCKGRLHHLRQTLEMSLIANKQIKGVEFILLNYDSPDELDSWVRSSLAKWLNCGMLKYYAIENQPFYISAHAKNIAHRCATADIICNLDSDNFATAEFSSFVVDFFSKHEKKFLHSPEVGTGTGGRLALRKGDFEALGGYNEDFVFGWGYEERDLIHRAKLSGLQEVFIPCTEQYLKAVQHSSEERTTFNTIKDERISNLKHREISKVNVQSNKIIANIGRLWGAADFTQVIAHSNASAADYENNCSP